MSLLKYLQRPEVLDDEDCFRLLLTRTAQLTSNWQCHATPYEICEKLTSKTPLENKNILVIFNPELVEHLIVIKGVDPKKVYYLGDNKVKTEVLRKKYGIQAKYVSKDDGIPGIKKAIESF